MEVCESAADRYPNNYNAWSHRSWVIQQFAAGDVKVRCSDGSRVARWLGGRMLDSQSR